MLRLNNTKKQEEKNWNLKRHKTNVRYDVVVMWTSERYTSLFAHEQAHNWPLSLNK